MAQKEAQMKEKAKKLLILLGVLIVVVRRGLRVKS